MNTHDKISVLSCIKINVCRFYDLDIYKLPIIVVDIR